METLEPLTGPASLVIDKVKQLSSVIVEHPGIDGFRIGRTNHPMAQRNAYHGCMELLTVYKTFEPFDAQKIERALKEMLESHPKWKDVPDPDMAVSADMAQFVTIIAW